MGKVVTIMGPTISRSAQADLDLNQRRRNSRTNRSRQAPALDQHSARKAISAVRRLVTPRLPTYGVR